MEVYVQGDDAKEIASQGARILEEVASQGRSQWASVRAEARRRRLATALQVVGGVACLLVVFLQVSGLDRRLGGEAKSRAELDATVSKALTGLGGRTDAVEAAVRAVQDRQSDLERGASAWGTAPGELRTDIQSRATIAELESVVRVLSAEGRVSDAISRVALRLPRAGGYDERTKAILGAVDGARTSMAKARTAFDELRAARPRVDDERRSEGWLRNCERAATEVQRVAALAVESLSRFDGD